MTVLCFGVNENRRLGEGWHEREVWGGGHVYRYMEARATLPLEAAWGGRSIVFLLSASASAVGRRVCVALRIAGRELAVFNLRDDRWRLVEARLPEELGEADVLEIVSAPAFVPDRVLRNGDHRSLGARVAAIRIGATEE